MEGDGFTTLLHFEREPGLFGLLAQLASRGFTIESVWPLPTFLDALPEPWPMAGAVTVLAVHPLRACAYRRAADGRRSAPAWCGDAAGQEAAAWLGGILRPNPSEPVLLVGNADLVTAFAACVAGLEKLHTQWLPLDEALNRGVVVPRRHPAQLRLPTPVVTPQFAVIAASVAFLALAIWSGAAYARDCLAWRTAGAAREAQKHALRTDVAQRRTAAAEIAALRASLALASAGPPCGELLRRLAATVPPEVALDSLRVSADGFSLNGHVAPHAPGGAVDGWRARLSAGQTPWQLHTMTPPTADGAFAFAGRFQP